MTSAGLSAGDALRLGAAAGGVISAIAFVYGRVRDAYRATVGRRRRARRQVRQLGVGVSRVYVEELLGAPMTRMDLAYEETPERPYRAAESLYRLHGAWVQTMDDTDGTVLAYSVTVTDRWARFRLRPYAAEALSTRPFVLGRHCYTHLSATPNDVHAFLGNTASSTYRESYYLGNPGGYLTYSFSYNDAGLPDLRTVLRIRELTQVAGSPYDHASWAPAAPQGDQFGSEITSAREGVRRCRPNTYTVASALHGDDLTYGPARTALRVLPGQRVHPSGLTRLKARRLLAKRV